MKYFFALGSNPALSLAELSAVLGPGSVRRENAFRPIRSDILICESAEALDPGALIKRLGGTIKIGELKAELNNPSEAAQTARAILGALPKAQAKLLFGLSLYGRIPLSLKDFALALKKYLRARGRSSRWVAGREPILSSVAVGQNKLLSRGAEIVLIQDNGKIYVGQTLAVQDYKGQSRRDYGRPARDDRSGLLPPKLARIMINLARPENKGGKNHFRLLDPFCGSGTILAEALLMGFNDLIGADVSAKAVADTRKNIDWLGKNFPLPAADIRYLEASATELSKKIPPRSADIIVTEPYLGPQRGKYDPLKTFKELERLYAEALKEFKKILRPNGRIVMVWPIFRGPYASRRLTVDLAGYRIISPLPEFLRRNENISLSDRQTIIYGRPGQKIWREIIILELKKIR